jgi:hypothetical protein
VNKIANTGGTDGKTTKKAGFLVETMADVVMQYFNHSFKIFRVRNLKTKPSNTAIRRMNLANTFP